MKKAPVEKKQAETDVRLSKQLLSLAVRILVVALILVVLFGLVFGLKRMDTGAMQPNVKDGDLVLYYRLDWNYVVGDVVVVKHQDRQYVLRIVATAGQTVDISDKGVLLVDGYHEIGDAYYETERAAGADFKYPYKVEAGKVFLVSDYRPDKNDSRLFGAVDTNEIKGKVITLMRVRGF